MRLFLCVALSLSLFALSSEAGPARTLVVLANVALRSRLSAFLGDLQGSFRVVLLPSNNY